MFERIGHVGQQTGSYRLLRLIGEGSISEVYLGEHSVLNKFAVIKLLKVRLKGDEASRFIREAELLSTLKHPSILRVLDVGIEVNDIPYLVMDYATHGSLRNRHPKGSQLSPELVLTYSKQIAAALQFAHDRGILHRDVKPENMMLGTSDEVLLSDFGIAALVRTSSFQAKQDIAGTITYMAPEQAQGTSSLPASDQYSLGVVVYEWLCGEAPFRGSFTEIALQHERVSPPSLREKNPAISRDVEQIVMITLAKDPKKRFVNMIAFSTALDQAIKSISLGSQAIYSFPPTPIPSRQTPSSPYPSSSPYGQPPSGPSLPPYAQPPYGPSSSPYGPLSSPNQTPAPFGQPFTPSSSPYSEQVAYSPQFVPYNQQTAYDSLPPAISPLLTNRSARRKVLVGLLGLTVAVAIPVVTSSRRKH